MRWPTSDFESRRVVELGERVLSEGLPELPETLSETMCIPVAYWTAPESAVVLFLEWSTGPSDRELTTGVLFPQFLRDDDGWRPASPWVSGKGWGTDPINGPPTSYALGRRAIVGGGTSWPNSIGPGSPVIVTGQVADYVTELSVVQSTAVRRRLDSHFGTFVVCLEEAGPYAIEAYDSSGQLVGTIAESVRVSGS